MLTPRSRVCGNQHAIIRKYGLNVCRQCFRERAQLIGFEKVRLAACVAIVLTLLQFR